LWAHELPSVRQQDDCAKEKREDLGCHARLGTVHDERTCFESRIESDGEVHGFAKDPWRPTGADAPDVYCSRSAHDGLRGINVVCTVAHRGQKACSGARTGTTTCRKTDPARVQVRGNARLTKRSQAAVGERQTARARIEPHDQAVQPCAGPPTAAMHIVVPAARPGVSQSLWKELQAPEMANASRRVHRLHFTADNNGRQTAVRQSRQAALSHKLNAHEGEAKRSLHSLCDASPKFGTTQHPLSHSTSAGLCKKSFVPSTGEQLA
jgi:hypothetical protein